jgi:hypothetical protein
VVHHVRKQALGQDLSVDDARGAKAATDAARSVRMLDGLSKEDAAKLGLEHPRRYFRVTDGKLNLWLPPEAGVWRKLESVKLGNAQGIYPGDDVQVATRFRMPSLLSGISQETFDELRAALSAGNWRQDSKANQWAGICVGKVLGIDSATTNGKYRINALLKYWIDKGMLHVEERTDPETRRKRKFVLPGAKKFELPTGLEADDLADL